MLTLMQGFFLYSVFGSQFDIILSYAALIRLSLFFHFVESSNRFNFLLFEQIRKQKYISVVVSHSPL